MKKSNNSILAAVCIAIGGFGASASAQTSLIDFTTIDFSLGNPLGANVINHTDGMAVQASDNVFAQLCIRLNGTTDAFVAHGTAVKVGTDFEGFVNSVTTDPVNFGAGTTLDFQIKVWDMDTGSTFDMASQRVTTPTATVVTKVSPDSPLATTGFGNVMLMDVVVIPEPSTVALGLIGGLALLMRRRRS